MTTITAHGQTIEALPVKDSFSRRATQFKNKILAAFKNAGISPDQVDIPEERAPMRKAAAIVSWYALGSYCHYSYARRNNYTENLYVVMRLLELELQSVVDGTKTAEDFAKEFAEDCMDFQQIDLNYKRMAKDAHPDMPNGSTEEFKKINNAHKTLKRELE